MIPTTEHNTFTEVHFSSFLTQLKTPPSLEDRMRLEEQWASPTSTATNPTHGTATTLQPLRSFTLNQSSTSYYGYGHLPLRQSNNFATPTRYYSQQLLPPRDAQSTSTASSWSTPTYSTDTPVVLGDYVHSQPPSQQSTLHSQVLQHSEPMSRSNDEDLAMDAQMLREVLQEMPTGQMPVHANHVTLSRGQQMPGLQLLFASPMHSTDMNNTTGSQPQVLGFYSSAIGMTTAPAEMLSQTQSAIGSVLVPPIFPSVHTSDCTVLPGTLPPAVAMIGTTGAYESTNSGAMVPILLRKKRTRTCMVADCIKGIRSRGLCKAHGGGRRCTTPGCTTSDQGGGHCVLHGGGRRCRIEGCKKSAQWRGVCKMHGGARRCRYGQCTKNGQVKQGYCRMHHNLLSAQRQQQEQGSQYSEESSAIYIVTHQTTPRMETRTSKSSTIASAGSRDDELINKMSTSHCNVMRSSVSEELARDKKKTILSGFRNMREALMAKTFESHDNTPVEVEVVSGLFVGSYGAANNKEALMGAGITHILCVSSTLPLNFPEVFTYLQLKVADQSSVNISELFDKAFAFIDSALSSGGKVLVHCFMGRSRSATIIIAFLMARHGFTYLDALRELRRVRPQAQPNSGFYQALISFEAKQKKVHQEVV
ncbi:unnamed protein product [Peronospora destructor]|uniref:protein-tyrosine-phosphatase n=1 Tax=Peronospora destructor TaxID=86335 RepID=A0AAV0TMZ2_9STRA|nr:unnamed protein product [Peronospora destructor]